MLCLPEAISTWGPSEGAKTETEPKFVQFEKVTTRAGDRCPAPPLSLPEDRGHEGCTESQLSVHEEI